MENNLKTAFQKNPLSGEITIPPDKSITHRALILSALVKSEIEVKNISLGEDCLRTLEIFKKLGINYRFLSKRNLIVNSSKGLIIPKENTVFDCGNSGTAARLLCGLFSSLEGINCTFIGDESLSKRPMKRIIEPLGLMGAEIKSNDNKLPLIIKGKKLNPVEYNSPNASAQVKSSILLAGLNTKGITRVNEPYLSRNHSEIMLEYLGADIKTGKDEKGYFCEIKKSELTPKNIEISGDISSCAFFMVMGAIVENSKITIKNVGINQTRAGIIDVFKQAQINFEIKNKRKISNEETADITVEYTPDIKPFKINGAQIPRLIDEIPVLAILAVCAKGTSIISDAFDLRNKESDRIKTIVDALKSLDVDVKELEDGFIIKGKDKIDKSAVLETHLDHRLAMSYFVLSLINKKEMIIKDFDCINTSFPEFMELAKDLGYGK